MWNFKRQRGGRDGQHDTDAKRAYEINSKSITTSDQMLQKLTQCNVGYG